jgi:hypothetical protein
VEAFVSCLELWLGQKSQKVDVAGLLKRRCVEHEDVQLRARESVMCDRGD